MAEKLRDAVIGTAKVTYEKRPSLYALRCVGCGRIFEMLPFCNDDNLAVIRGTFDRDASDADGRELGNMFSANVCSFDCAHRVFRGGWRKISEWAPFVSAGASLVRAELTITSYVKGEQEIIDEWESAPERKPQTAFVSRS